MIISLNKFIFRGRFPFLWVLQQHPTFILKFSSPSTFCMCESLIKFFKHTTRKKKYRLHSTYFNPNHSRRTLKKIRKMSLFFRSTLDQTFTSDHCVVREMILILFNIKGYFLHKRQGMFDFVRASDLERMKK